MPAADPADELVLPPVVCASAAGAAARERLVIANASAFIVTLPTTEISSTRLAAPGFPLRGRQAVTKVELPVMARDIRLTGSGGQGLLDGAARKD